MPIDKVLLMFSADKYSWTEDYFFNDTQTVNAGANVIAASDSLARQRAQLLGSGAALERVRISNTQPANSQVWDIEYNPVLTGQWAGVSSSAAASRAARPYQVILVRMQTFVGDHRNLYLAGAPNGLFGTRPGDDTGLDFSQFGQFLPALQGYIQTLINQNFGYLTRTRNVFQATQGLVTLAQYAGMVGVVTLASIPGVVAGGSVLVKGWRRYSVKASKQFSGVYRVFAVVPPVSPATTWTYMLANTPTISPTNFPVPGLIAPFSLTLLSWNSGTPVEATERKRGATALRPRGRSRTR